MIKDLDEYRIDKADLKEWFKARITQAVLEIMKDRFNFGEALLSSEDGHSLDRLKGQAEVIHFMTNITDQGI